MRLKCLAILLVWTVSGYLLAAEFSTQYDASYIEGLNNSQQRFPGKSTVVERQSVQFEGTYNATHIRTTLHNLRTEAQPTQHQLDLNELYWEGTAGSWDVTVGKKLLDWGVGYGFRPLDLFNQQNRRSLIAESLLGLPMINGEYFSDTAALTALCASGHADINADKHGADRCAIRYYSLMGNWDIQALAYYDDKDKFSVGSSFSGVISDTTELHGSIRIPEEDHEESIKALLGFTYTTMKGYSLVGEIWKDGITDNTIAEPEELLLLSLSYDGEKTDPTIDVLYAMEDNGLILTAKADTELSGHYKLSYGIRSYHGENNSFYRGLADRQLLFINFNASF